MGFLRLILLLLLAALLYRWLRRWWERKAARKRTLAQDQGRMLACAHCGVYFPEREAVREGDQVFCSPAHRLAHRRD
ncbi:MAG: PP0621 family protein [Gammaproteobacteria bacterium]